MTAVRNAATTERYDRQIRLWGEAGQTALSCAAVLVIGSTVTATETLKNLVLPGVGSFTIVDGATCADTHAANFFVPIADSSPSAASAARHLAELNPQVRASYIAAEPTSFLTDTNAAVAFVSRYSLVIVSQQGGGHPSLRLIATAAADAHVPLLVVRSYGTLGLVRLQFPDGTAAVQSDRADAPPDLRLHAPFPELSAAADAARSTLRDPDAAAHVPFVIILLLALSDYRTAHKDALPIARAERDELRNRTLALRPEACPEDALNFAEAVKPAHLRLCCASATELPYNVKALFADPRADPDASAPPPSSFALAPLSVDGLPRPVRLRGDDADEPAGADGTRAPDELSPPGGGGAPPSAAQRVRQEDDAFWVHVAAVRAFYERNGALPVSGALPDMTADTVSYIALQRVYSSRAAADAREVLSIAHEVAERRGIAGESPADAVSVAAFCKTARQAHVVRSRSVLSELNMPGESGFLAAARDAGALDAALPNSPAAYYPLFRAVDLFYREHGRHPGANEACLDADAVVVRDNLAKVKEELGGAPGGLWRDEADEMMRFAGAELHNVAALIGGVAAQEAIKIITRQFVPLDNTTVFNFSNMTSLSFSA